MDSGRLSIKFGGVFVAAVAADDRAVDFEQLRGFAQYASDFAIFHGAIIEQTFEE